MSSAQKLYVVFFAVLGLAVACNRQPRQRIDDAPAAVLTQEEAAQYVAQGKEIAAATFAALSSRLQEAMQQGGVAYAAPFCSTVALPLADSLSIQYGAEIRRTSLLIRNPKDAPLPHERAALERYETQWQKQEPLQPSALLLEDGKTVAFYAPIHVNAFCLTCHGKLGETLSEKDYAAIKALYPEDQAIGYADGDWRGIWSISFKK